VEDVAVFDMRAQGQDAALDRLVVGELDPRLEQVDLPAQDGSGVLERQR